MFGSVSGRPTSIEDIKNDAAERNRLSNNGNSREIASIQYVAGQVGVDRANELAEAATISSYTVESAQDIRVYLRYRF